MDTLSSERGTGLGPETPTSSYVVGSSRLEGRVSISGAKNSVLRLLAASLLTDDSVQITNYPAGLLDAQVHLAMLEALGKRCAVNDDAVTIDADGPPLSTLVWSGRSIRNTLLVLGALVARTGAGAVPLPGGCDLGGRPHDLHELVLTRLGARVWQEGDYLRAEAPDGLIGNEIHLPIRSTGATENAIISSSLAKGTTRIWNPHVRPEILDLIAFLRSMGAKIQVHGQEHIEVVGVDGLGGTSHDVIADGMEAVTWLVASVMTDGDVEIHGFPWDDLEVPLIHLRASGSRVYRDGDDLIVRGGRCLPIEIATGPYPGINSDMQPLFAVFGALAHGTSKIVDLRFPGRYAYATELARMGVRHVVADNLLTIHGGAPLRGTRVRALDLRAGVALTLAGWVAEDETIIDDAWQIERGYDRFVEKARGLGARIDRRDD